ncbi:MAG: tetratricopeptide repeat protein [Thermaceae bacterium]
MERVFRALHEGDYDTALELLHRRSLYKKEALLLLAEVYSLGEALEEAHGALEEARQEIPGLEVNPLYRALLAELLALEGRSPEEVRGVFLKTRDPRARYHQAMALFYLGIYEEALNLLPTQGLPAFLAWRAWSVRGRILERLGRHAEAARAHREAARLALGLERYGRLLDAAAMHLEAGEAEEALQVLEEAASSVELEGPEDGVTRNYFLARAYFLLGHFQQALAFVEEALRLEGEEGHPAYETPLLKAQILLVLGREEEAREAFREALHRAEGEERAQVLREMGAAALDQGEYLEAEQALSELIRLEPDYPYLGQAYGDLAKALYHQGRYQEAEAMAKEAIRLGAVSAGELILGHVAYDLLNLEEALEHYHRAAEAAEEGSRDWVRAMEMVVDTLAQLGYRNPGEMVERAERVLPHLNPSDEWFPVLQAHLERARGLLSRRNLN